MIKLKVSFCLSKKSKFLNKKKREKEARQWVKILWTSSEIGNNLKGCGTKRDSGKKNSEAGNKVISLAKLVGTLLPNWNLIYANLYDTPQYFGILQGRRFFSPLFFIHRYRSVDNSIIIRIFGKLDD